MQDPNSSNEFVYKRTQIQKKKTYDFYKHSGNMWDSLYLSSPKISKFYLEKHEAFLAGPNSPQKISLMESSERSRMFIEKAIHNKLKSRQMLFERKKKREDVTFT